MATVKTVEAGVEKKMRTEKVNFKAALRVQLSWTLIDTGRGGSHGADIQSLRRRHWQRCRGDWSRYAVTEETLADLMNELV